LTAYDLFSLGFLLITLGFIMVFVSIAMMALRGGGKAKGGGVVLLGPIPIVFGSDADAVKAVLLLAIAFTVIVLLLFLAPWWSG